MGELVLVFFGIVVLVGIALVGVGLIRGSRLATLAGVAVLLAAAGAWLLGLWGVILAAAVLPFVRTRSARTPR